METVMKKDWRHPSEEQKQPRVFFLVTGLGARHDRPLMAIKALLFDLDDTLMVDEAVSHETFAHVAAEASSRFGADAARFASDAMEIARQLWSVGECRPFCRSIGISAFECLWGGFTADSPS